MIAVSITPNDYTGKLVSQSSRIGICKVEDKLPSLPAFNAIRDDSRTCRQLIRYNNPGDGGTLVD